MRRLLLAGLALLLCLVLAGCGVPQKKSTAIFPGRRNPGRYGRGHRCGAGRSLCPHEENGPEDVFRGRWGTGLFP